MFIIYENKDFSFFWKPHGIPSTFGKEKSFLDFLKEGDMEFDTKDYESMKQYIAPEYKKIQNLEFSIQNLLKTFTKEQEFGLLNRLDNDTAGFLYFAKDLSIFDQYKQLQAQNQMEKHYIAQVQGYPCPPLQRRGTPKRRGGGFMINFPIMHRSLEKMIAIKDPKDLKKGRGKEHTVQTFVELLNYDKKSDISTLLVKIHKGIRHQIRVHLASVGFPIIGDSLYGKLQKDKILHLRSIKFEVKK